MRGCILKIAGLVVAINASTVRAQEPRENTEWQFSETTSDCSAWRNHADNFVFLALRQDSRVVFRVHDKSWTAAPTADVSASIELTDGDLILTKRAPPTTNGWTGFFELFPEDALAQMASSDSSQSRLTTSEGDALSLEGLATVSARLQACARQLVRLSPADYPVKNPVPSPLSLGEEYFRGVPRPTARLSYKLTIGRNGRPTKCDIVKSSGEPLFDERACQILLKKAVFSPALNAAGVPVTGTFQSSIVL